MGQLLISFFFKNSHKYEPLVNKFELFNMIVGEFFLSMKDVDTILFESETGMEKVSGMGYKGPFTEILRDLNRDLIEKGIRSQITLIVSGGINKREHVPKAIGCGADLAQIDVPLHITLQSEFKERDDECEIILKR